MLLTADQVAERFQVPKAQVYRLTREGRLPAVRVGRYCRYRAEAIDEWELAGGAGVDGSERMPNPSGRSMSTGDPACVSPSVSRNGGRRRAA